MLTNNHRARARAGESIRTLPLAPVSAKQNPVYNRAMFVSLEIINKILKDKTSALNTCCAFLCSDIESRDLINVALVYSEDRSQECNVFGGVTLLI